MLDGKAFESINKFIPLFDSVVRARRGKYKKLSEISVKGIWKRKGLKCESEGLNFSNVSNNWINSFQIFKFIFAFFFLITSDNSI